MRSSTSTCLCPPHLPSPLDFSDPVRAPGTRVRFADWPSHTPAHLFPRIFTKYPNPYATHVQTVDTLSRTVDPETGIIRSERLLGVSQGAPRWITKLFQLPPMAYVREIIFIDPSEPKATMMSVNLSLAQYV